VGIKLEQKTVFVVGIDITGKLNFIIDPEWLAQKIIEEGSLSPSVLSLCAMLDYAKLEIQNQLYDIRCQEYEDSEQQDDIDEQERGGVDEINGLDFDDEDEDWKK